MGETVIRGVGGMSPCACRPSSPLGGTWLEESQRGAADAWGPGQGLQWSDGFQSQARDIRRGPVCKVRVTNMVPDMPSFRCPQDILGYLLMVWVYHKSR